MKRFVSLLLLTVLVIGLISGCDTQTDDRVTINVYNWGQYISEGDDGCIDVIAEFEKAYPNIKVNYVTFDSNETMYTKMAGGGITVDVIIPSDYMVGRLIEAAKKAGADYAVDVYPFYGSDVEATLQAGADIRHGLIGPGVYASHGYERSHINGVLNTLKLLEKYLTAG